MASLFQQVVCSAESQRSEANSHDPCAWGIIALQLVDELSSEAIGVHSCEAVLPDGTWVRIPEMGHCVPLGGLKARIPVGGVGTIWLATGGLHRSPWVSASPVEPARFRIQQSRLTADIFEPERDKDQLAVLERDFRLYLTLGKDHLAAPLTGIPIAKVEHRTDGRLIQVQAFAPPCRSLLPVIRTPHFESLRSLLTEIDESIYENSMYHAHKLNQLPQEPNIDYDTLRSILTLQALGACGQSLRAALLANDGTHPLLVYRELARLFGALWTFSRDTSLRLPVYQHDRLYETFDEIVSLLHAMLERKPQPKHDPARLTINLDSKGNKIYSAEFQQPELLTSRYIYLGIKTQLAWPDLKRLLEPKRNIKVTAPGKGPDLFQAQLDGIPFDLYTAQPRPSWMEPGLKYLCQYDPADPRNQSKWSSAKLQMLSEVHQRGSLEIYTAVPEGVDFEIKAVVAA